MQEFQFTVEQAPEFALGRIIIPPGRKLFVEASAMAAMSSHIKMKAMLKGGFRRFLARESLFIVEYSATGFAGEVSIAPGPSGDLHHWTVKPNEAFYLASTCFVAHSDGVKFETKFQKLAQGLLSGMGWFLARFTGEGDLWFNGYGKIVELDSTSDLVVDNGHVVGFTEGVEYDIIRLGGYKSLFFSGEGFVLRFRGSGKVFIQTKKPAALISWAHFFRPVQSSNS